MKFIAIAVVATIGRACAASQRKRINENKYTTASESERRDVRFLDPYLGLAERKLEKEEIMSMDNHDNDGDGEK